MHWIAGALVVTTVWVAGWSSAPTLALAQSSVVDAGPHEVLRFENGRFQNVSDDGWADITDITAYCLECHGDGDAGDAASEKSTVPNSSHELGGLGRSHPVDVDYPSRDTGYHPIEELDEKIKLVDGRLTCLTCHESSVDRSLVLQTKGGLLCIACHEM